MTGRELGTALLIGAVSGVVVAIMAAALSGASVTGFLEMTPSGPTSPLPTNHSSPASPSVAPSNDVTPPPTAVSTTPSPVPSPTTSPPATAAALFEEVGVKAGLPDQNGTYGSTTPAVARGEYISWRVVVGAAASGQAIDVEVATRLNGTWTGWSRLTTRVVDAEGVVVFSWRQLTPAWISVRFAQQPAVSTALQGRWR
jgi:hypothetical protein